MNQRPLRQTRRIAGSAQTAIQSLSTKQGVNPDGGLSGISGRTGSSRGGKRRKPGEGGSSDEDMSG